MVVVSTPGSGAQQQPPPTAAAASTSTSTTSCDSDLQHYSSQCNSGTERTARRHGTDVSSAATVSSPTASTKSSAAARPSTRTAADADGPGSPWRTPAGQHPAATER